MNTSRGQALLNGLIVCLIGLAVYMTPAFVVAFRLAFELASQKQGSAAISAQISQNIATLYAENVLPQVELMVIVGLLVAWRVWAARRGMVPAKSLDGLPKSCQLASPSQTLQSTEEKKNGRGPVFLLFFRSSVEILARRGFRRCC
jgi:hypothetical protein